MSHKNVIRALALPTVALFSAVLVTQQQSNPSQDKSGPMGRGMGGAMMMGQMMAQNQEMSQLMNKLMQSMTAINSEKDPAKLKALLAEHATLLDQMRNKMMGQGNMMQNMAGQMKNCPAMGAATKPASK
jgi:NADH pyrophosphatase NudC (nudix superfamily)